MIKDFITTFPEPIAVIIFILFTSLVGFIAWWVRIIRHKIISHVDKEETITWPNFEVKVNIVSAKMQENHLEYIKRFGYMDKRLALLEVTNGELKEVLLAVNNLSTQITKMTKERNVNS